MIATSVRPSAPAYRKAESRIASFASGSAPTPSSAQDVAALPALVAAHLTAGHRLAGGRNRSGLDFRGR
ncbi:hypothetical protein [Nocardioides endophyticus]|uniref:hypothetical protein n=1 Tax=Nocardioides endophyticus TaxID=1353775 RepID=UPI0031E815B7